MDQIRARDEMKQLYVQLKVAQEGRWSGFQLNAKEVEIVMQALEIAGEL